MIKPPIRPARRRPGTGAGAPAITPVVAPAIAPPPGDPATVPAGKMRNYLPHYISRLMNLLNMRLMDSLRPLGISVQQFRVMQVIDARGVAAIGEIATDAVIDQSVVSRVVDRLEADKLAVRRKRRGNGRIVEVYLTRHGQATYAAMLPAAQAIVDDAVEPLTAEEQAQLREMLRRVFEHVSRPYEPWMTVVRQAGER